MSKLAEKEKLLVEPILNREKRTKEKLYSLLSLSAKTEEALAKKKLDLIEYFRTNMDKITLTGVAYTLHTAREEFNNRQILVCKEIPEALSLLSKPENELSLIQFSKHVLTVEQAPKVVFLCSGVGEHYVNMGRELYETEPYYREQVDKCSEILTKYLAKDIREVIFNDGEKEAADMLLNSTDYLQVSVFVLGYAGARYWLKCGVELSALIGHSTGEYLAACLAGVFSVEDTLQLIVKRAQIIGELPKGAMLAVPLCEEEVKPFLSKDVSLGAVNGPSLCVLSGKKLAIEETAMKLLEQGVRSKCLPVSHAFHSEMMVEAKDQLLELFSSVKYHEPIIPYISNLTGKKVTAEEVMNPSYWYWHTCKAVRFSDGIKELLIDNTLFLEVGPGRNLVSAVLQHQTKEINLKGKVLNTIRNSNQEENDHEQLLSTLGKLWLQGVKINWKVLYN